MFVLALLLLGPFLASPLAGQAPSPPAGSSATDSTNRSVDRIEATAETALHAAPEGAPLATLHSGAPARIVGRVDGWARVQVEGWVREADIRPGTGAALTGVTATEVRAEPDRYVGRTVDWRLQVIAVQTADELRSEMLLGQPYLLTRGPLPETGFVYVTLSKEQAERLSTLPPLEELVLRVTIRAARTRYLETPVVDLVAVVSDGRRGQR